MLVNLIMGLFSRRRIHKAVDQCGQVDISEENGVRSLHLGSHTVQSAMRVNRPYDLEVEYTRRMVAFLLFHPEPQDALLIGLGGGSLSKFLHHHFPQLRSVTVEINPQVVAAARSFFLVPPDDERFSVVVGDGARYVAEHPESCDVLLLDGYDERCQVEELATQDFYDRCFQALAPDGVLAVNLWGSDPRFEAYYGRIGNAFDGRALLLPSVTRGNMIVLAFKRDQGSPRWQDLRQHARELEARYGLEFLKFVEGLKDNNLHTEKRLLI
jgi:spermidine synthase